MKKVLTFFLATLFISSTLISCTQHINYQDNYIKDNEKTDENEPVEDSSSTSTHKPTPIIIEKKPTEDDSSQDSLTTDTPIKDKPIEEKPKENEPIKSNDQLTAEEIHTYIENAQSTLTELENSSSLFVAKCELLQTLTDKVSQENESYARRLEIYEQKAADPRTTAVALKTLRKECQNAYSNLLAAAAQAIQTALDIDSLYEQITQYRQKISNIVQALIDGNAPQSEIESAQYYAQSAINYIDQINESYDTATYIENIYKLAEPYATKKEIDVIVYGNPSSTVKFNTIIPIIMYPVSHDVMVYFDCNDTSTPYQTLSQSDAVRVIAISEDGNWYKVNLSSTDPNSYYIKTPYLTPSGKS